MVIWTYFSSALREAVDSLTGYTAMLTKVYFPRLILPLSSVLGKLVDLSIVFLFFIPVMLWYGVVPRIEAIVVVPSLILILILTTLGLALWLSALAVQYRDVSHGLAFAIQALMYVSPVVYSDHIVPQRLSHFLRTESGRRRDRRHARRDARDRPSAVGPRSSGCRDGFLSCRLGPVLLPQPRVHLRRRSLKLIHGFSNLQYTHDVRHGNRC